MTHGGIGFCDMFFFIFFRRSDILCGNSREGRGPPFLVCPAWYIYYERIALTAKAAFCFPLQRKWESEAQHSEEEISFLAGLLVIVRLREGLHYGRREEETKRENKIKS